MTSLKVPPSPTEGKEVSFIKQVGFTLIELSIVLVIIGLIVGGVLVGQDLIKAAEVRATVSQYEKYNSAVNTFRTKYNGIPGDLLASNALAFGLCSTCTGFDGSVGKGDGNGLLESTTSIAAQLGEPVVFWRHLSDSSLLGDNVGAGLSTVGAMTTSGASYFYPPAKMGRGNYWVAGSNSGLNYYLLGTVTGTSTTDAGISTGLTPIESYNIDSKIDDGMPNTGTVQARGTSNASNTLLGTLVAGNVGTNASSEAATTCQLGATSTGTSNTYARGTTAGSSPNCLLRMRFN